MLSKDESCAAAERLVERAIRAGADAADAICSASHSMSVQVRLGELEDVSRSESEEIGLRLFFGSRAASVASSSLSDDVLDEIVGRALAMAKEAPEDPYAGLAPTDRLASAPFIDLDTVDSTQLEPGELRERALAAESAALAVDGVTNSSGASASVSSSTLALVTSHGFSGAYSATGFSCSAAVVAGSGAAMQRDHAWHSARHLADLSEPGAIGRLAGERASARVDPVRPKSGKMPVIFDPRVATSLLGHLAAAISGQAVARKSSFLTDRLGERIFGREIEVIDDPLRPRGLRSRPFDGEGVNVGRRSVVADGILQCWIAESSAARQLGISPTGHASRSPGSAPGVSPSNFYIAPGKRSRAQLLAAFPQALLVTELIGQGVNQVTGDYSRGAAGFLVRDGVIGAAVQEVTIASNLVEMFATLEPASDLEFRHGIDAPTILVPEMTIGTA